MNKYHIQLVEYNELHIDEINNDIIDKTFYKL